MLTESELQAVTEQMPDLWGLLSDEEKQTFAETLNIQVYRKHQMVYHEGESPDHLLCLLSGKVKIFREGVGGRSQIMRIMAPGQYFGYRASLAAEPYVTAATAFEESKICAIPMGVVKEAMLHNNDLCQFFIRELATDLGIADRRTVSLTQKHIRGRLAESILFLKDTYGVEKKTNTIDIQLSRKDLADLSNMTTSNAIRTLTNFANEGLIEIHGRKISILSEERMRRISLIG